MQYSPLWMARSGAIALWCHTVMSRVQGNTINTMARISLLFGISRIGGLARHYLETRRIHLRSCWSGTNIQTPKLSHCEGAPSSLCVGGACSGGTPRSGKNNFTVTTCVFLEVGRVSHEGSSVLERCCRTVHRDKDTRVHLESKQC